VRFATIVARTRLVGGFPGPFVDCELIAVAADDEPAHGVVALYAANFTSISSADHWLTSRQGMQGTRDKGNGNSGAKGTGEQENKNPEKPELNIGDKLTAFRRSFYFRRSF
jgi:hypothetical protein